jgi:transposase-like protein
MTSRTNRHSEGQNHRGKTRTSPSALERRRQEAVERYLADDPIEAICREMRCSKSWLYKWKRRYQATDPTWFQEPQMPEDLLST